MMQKYVVEFLGTLFFLYVVLVIGKPLAVALALYVAILVGGKMSGGYFNPAITVMMAAANKLPMKHMFPYLVAQVGGGLTALALSRQVGRFRF